MLNRSPLLASGGDRADPTLSSSAIELPFREMARTQSACQHWHSVVFDMHKEWRSAPCLEPKNRLTCATDKLSFGVIRHTAHQFCNQLNYSTDGITASSSTFATAIHTSSFI